DIGKVLALLRSECQEATPGTWPHWRAWRLYAIAYVTACCGMRKNEVLRLRREDIDLAERMIWIRARKGNQLKTESSEQPVPIPDALATVLSEWLTTVLDAQLVPE